jgi:hypothetical protein
MCKPRKHAALIKAWADGADIQVYSCGEWVDTQHPAWDEYYDYRISLARKYCVGLIEDMVVIVTTDDQARQTERARGFIKWLDGWREYDAVAY